MPATFYSDITVEIVNNEGVVLSTAGSASLTEFTCRDSWSYTTKRYIGQAFDLLLGTEFAAGQDEHGFYHTVHKYHQNIRLKSGTYMRSYAGIEYTTARAAEKLRRKYPTVTLEPRTNVLGFGNVQVFGIHLEGDCSVFPAFYWASLIMRHARVDQNPRRTDERPWKDVAQLLERALDSRAEGLGSYRREHLDIWRDIVANGDQIPSWYHAATACGPISVRELADNPNNFLIARIAERDRSIATGIAREYTIAL